MGVFRIEGRALTVNQEGRGTNFTQIGEHLPQVDARLPIGHLAPEHPGQRIAGVRPARHRQVKEHGPRLVADEILDGPGIQKDLRSAEQQDF